MSRLILSCNYKLLIRCRNHKQENRILSNWTQIQSLTMSTESIIPINSLQSNQKIWTIEAMVLRQGIIETFNNVQNNGKIWKMILVDNMGTKIQAVMFNEAIRKFEGIFQHSKAYLISNGTVKKPNEKFSNVHPSLELVLQQHTNVQETTSTFDAHIFANEFVKFKKIQKHIEINPYVDIFGFVSSVGQSYVIKKKNGGETHKREITIMNKELDSLPITFWGDMALNEGQMLQENFDKKQIIVVSNLNGTTYQGQFQLSTTNMSTIQFDPHCVQVQKLKKWLHSSPTDEIDVQQLAVEKKIKQAKEINIRDLLTNPSPIMENTLYYFQATIDDVENKDQPWYHIRLEVIDGNDKPIVILFDEPATSLIGCTISNYINSVRKSNEILFGVTLVSHPLTETNYNTWHQSMLIALSIKNKVGFIDGTVSKPSDPAAALQWTHCNNMVKAWLLNSLSKDTSTSVIYCDLAKDIYVELKERFSQVNRPWMFQLEQDIHNLVQSTTSVTTYFTKLKMLWDELSSLQSHLIHEKVSQYQQYQRTMKFLMGLNESYAAIQGKILLMNPLPSINRVYGLILQEETQRNIQALPSIDGVALAAKGILPSPKDHQAPPRKKSLKCTHCHKDGHTINRCYFIHGFPPGSRKTGTHYKSSAHQVFSTTSTPSTSSLPFTLDQCLQLLTLLNNATQSSSMATHVSNTEHSLSGIPSPLSPDHLWILDSGATDHMVHIVYMGALPEGEYSPSSPSSYHTRMLEEVVESSFTSQSLIRSYTRSFNAFAANLTQQEQQKLASFEGVVSIFPSKTLQPHTTRSWDCMGFSENVHRNPTIESDVIVGVIDTGIWPEVESFRDEGFGPPPKKWKGECKGGRNFTCNKVPRNRHVGCLDDVIADGVDIISISIGGEYAFDLINDSIAIGAFHAMERGILTINSAGNSGFSKSTVSSVAPWIVTVAASTTDLQTVDKVVLGNGRTLVGNAINSFELKGSKFPLVYETDVMSECDKFSARLHSEGCLESDSMKGKIVLCFSPTRIEQAHKAGALGSIAPSETFLGADVSLLVPMPASVLSSQDFDLVKSYVNSTNMPQANILKSETRRDFAAPVVASFSSRGPNPIIPDILKPDICAPGVDILAAFSPAASPSRDPLDKRSVKYSIMSGTSMACPHASGAAAYVKSLHPNWSPSAIRSSLMTSASPMNARKKLVLVNSLMEPGI
ncbi:hypothetical protein F0562_033738 [Nyssa sinensis]|uniref:Uncharacterized protein n=1 Tax=Nyssa sinensis TaxID=561372 RepID=A0A5J5AEN5_9ASTE|nr:hypothetical protein F0562_033738 [Nyssa sinensis]